MHPQQYQAASENTTNMTATKCPQVLMQKITVLCPNPFSHQHNTTVGRRLSEPVGTGGCSNNLKVQKIKIY